MHLLSKTLKQLRDKNMFLILYSIHEGNKEKTLNKNQTLHDINCN